MTTKAAIEEIKFRLGQIKGLQSQIELSTDDIQQLLSLSLRELVEKVDTPSMLIIPYQSVIDVSEYKIAKIDLIMRSNTPYGTTHGLTYDPFYISNTVSIGSQGASGQAGIHSVLQMQAQYAIRAMAQNVVQAELHHFHDLYNKKLYVSYSGQAPISLTILYRPEIQAVEDLPSPIWQSYLMRLAVAHGKVIIGRIRSKYSVSGAPVTVNSEILAEGLSELEKIYEELKQFTGRWVV